MSGLKIFLGILNFGSVEAKIILLLKRFGKCSNSFQNIWYPDVWEHKSN